MQKSAPLSRASRPPCGPNQIMHADYDDGAFARRAFVGQLVLQPIHQQRTAGNAGEIVLLHLLLHRAEACLLLLEHQAHTRHHHVEGF